jgi:DNA topoisomerase I
MTRLLLIESPGKIKKLSQILGAGWLVKASMGHIRELANDGEDALGFDLEGDRVVCRYLPRSDQAKQILKELKAIVKTVDQVYIATDPDREGETIGWHLQQELKLKSPLRIVYTEITPNAIKAALAQPRSLNANLIAAGRARDCLDKLVGYKGSRHVVWPLNIGAKSMGRVQSATLHLICQREQEILQFKPQDYWSVWVQYQEGFKAFYCAQPTAKLTSAPPEETEDNLMESLTDQNTVPGRKKSPHSPPSETVESDRVTSQIQADRLVEIAKIHPHRVVKVEGQLTRQTPPPPFTTSTLQQAAGSQLKWAPDYTMKIAQSLYEAGRITYMRTDSVSLADDFVQAARTYLQQQDPTNLPPRATHHRSSKNAQEAHEAVRPTHIFDLPGQIAVTGDGAKLYDLIWRRSLASLCASAQIRKTQILTQSGEVHWRSRGQVLEFPGYTRYWNNLKADQQLPPVQPGQGVQCLQAQADQKQTQPPPRYPEPKLVQLMERKGIGRPSTYAPTLKTLKTREYVQVVDGKLQPTALGMTLDRALEQLLPDLIKPEFTAQMESVLDSIAQGQQDWEQYLLNWHRSYFGPAVQWARQQLGQFTQAGTFAKSSEQTPSAPEIQADRLGNKRQPKSSSAAILPDSSNVVFSTESGTELETPVPPKTKARRSKSGVKSQSQSQSKSDSKSPPRSTPRSSPKTSVKSENKAQLSDRSCPSSCPDSCPSCGDRLDKIPSRSKKLQADHFLRCQNPSCGTVMFWNKTKKQYELPYAKRSPDPNAITDIPCPQCHALLEKYSYQKDGKDKLMLRCSIPENRKGKCKDVAFFQSQDGFWSPTYGLLQDLNSQARL